MVSPIVNITIKPSGAVFTVSESTIRERSGYVKDVLTTQQVYGWLPCTSQIQKLLGRKATACSISLPDTSATAFAVYELYLKDEHASATTLTELTIASVGDAYDILLSALGDLVVLAVRLDDIIFLGLAHDAISTHLDNKDSAFGHHVHLEVIDSIMKAILTSKHCTMASTVTDTLNVMLAKQQEKAYDAVKTLFLNEKRVHEAALERQRTETNSLNEMTKELGQACQMVRKAHQLVGESDVVKSLAEKIGAYEDEVKSLQKAAINTSAEHANEIAFFLGWKVKKEAEVLAWKRRSEQWEKAHDDLKTQIDKFQSATASSLRTTRSLKRDSGTFAATDRLFQPPQKRQQHTAHDG